jgi:hypothetical protein
MEEQIVDASQRIEVLKAETVEAIMVFVRTAADFAAQEVPLLVQEVLKFGLLDNGIWAALWTVCFGVSLFLFVKALRWVFDDDSCDCESKAAGLIASGATSIGSGCLMLLYGIDTLQVVIAPRMYLLKVLTSL